MPRPFAPPSGRLPRFARRRARWAAARAAMQLANQAAAAVSWLALGSPTNATQARAALSRLAVLRLSSAQRQAAAGFLARARPFARRGLSDLRGARAAVASTLPLPHDAANYNRVSSARRHPRNAQAVFVVAARVSLPPVGAVVPVTSWISDGWISRLSRPDGLLHADCRAAFGFPLRPGDPPQLDNTAVGQYRGWSAYP